MTTAWGGQPPNINASTQTHWGSSAIGLLGSTIKAAGATGEHGAGIAINDSLVDASEYLFWIVSQPAGGTVAMTELAQATLVVSADGTYPWVYAFRENGIDRGTATVTDVIGSDTVAPVLSGATVSATGQTTAAGTISTNEGNGTLYRLATANATETVAAIKAGGLSQSVVAAGARSVAFTGLTVATTYYAHFAHTDASGNDSSRLTSAAFTTAAAPPTPPPAPSGPTTRRLTRFEMMRGVS